MSRLGFLRSCALVSCVVLGSTTASLGRADADVEAELAVMRDTILQLQDQVRGQQAQIDTQRDQLVSAGIEEERGAASALSSFLTTTEFSGSIAASYFYNTNRPRPVSGRGGGAGGGGENTWVPGAPVSNPFHPDHNSIQFDELWLSAARSATDELPVGFGFDIVYGALADINSGGGSGCCGNNVWIAQAYIDYVAPWGTQLTVGKFGTHIGYEVAGAAYNDTITRGFSYQSFQPVSQIGVKLYQDIGPVTLMVGATNGFGEEQVDIDSVKDVIWQVAYSGDLVSVLFNGEYGGDAEWFGGRTGDEAMILDGIIELTPSDMTTVYADLTYATVFENTSEGRPWGIALNVGAHQAITDKFGLTGRLEYGHGNNEGGAQATIFMPNGGTKTDAIALTAGADYLLAEGLTIKGEVKWEQILGIDNANDAFLPASGSPEDYQVLVGAQLVYAF